MRKTAHFLLSGLVLSMLILQAPLSAFASVSEYVDPQDYLDIGGLVQPYHDVERPMDAPHMEDYATMEAYYAAMDEYHTQLGINYLSYNVKTSFSDSVVPQGGLTADSVIGYESNIDGFREFRPENNLNRAEMAKLMTMGLVMDIGSSFSTTNYLFPDTNFGDWYAGYFAILKKLEIIGGTPGPDGVLIADPVGTVNGAQAAKFITNSFQLHDGMAVDEASAAVWYDPYYDILLEKNIIYTRDSLDPSTPVTRGQVLMMMYRATIVQAATLAYGGEFQDEEILAQFEDGFVFSDDLATVVTELLGTVRNQAAAELDSSVTVTYMLDLFRTSDDPVKFYAIEDYTELYSPGEPADETIYLYNQNESGAGVDLTGYTVSVMTSQTGLNFYPAGLRYTFGEELIVGPGEVAELPGNSFYANPTPYVHWNGYVQDELFAQDEYTAVLLYNPQGRLVDVAIAYTVGD